MLAQVVGNLLNLFLNWLLIYGNWGFPQMGAPGAGLASTIAVVVACIIVAPALFRNKLIRRYRYERGLRIDRGILRRMVAVGWPVGLQALLINGGFLAFLYINKEISVTAVSLTQSIIFLTTISFLPVVGIGVAAATMVGQYLGAGNMERARRSVWITVSLGIVIMIVFGFVYFVAGHHLLELYIHDEKDIKRDFLTQGAIILKIIACFQFFDAIGVVLARILQSAGLARFVMFVEVSLFWLLFLPAAYVLGVVLEHGVIGAWCAFMLYLISYATLMVVRYRKGDWIKGEV